MSNPEGLGRLLRAGLLVGLLVGAGIGVQAIVRPEPVDAPVEPVDLVEATDSDPSMDLAHLRGRDIEFLASVLREGTPEGRRSATRALLISGDARGVSVLFSVPRTTSTARPPSRSSESRRRWMPGASSLSPQRSAPWRIGSLWSRRS